LENINSDKKKAAQRSRRKRLVERFLPVGLQRKINLSKLSRYYINYLACPDPNWLGL
jgi:hypothetical protein